MQQRNSLINVVIVVGDVPFLAEHALHVAVRKLWLRAGYPKLLEHLEIGGEVVIDQANNGQNTEKYEPHFYFFNRVWREPKTN